MQNETIDKLKNAGYITVTDDSQGIADKVGVPEAFPYEFVKLPDVEFVLTEEKTESFSEKVGEFDYTILPPLNQSNTKIIIYTNTKGYTKTGYVEGGLSIDRLVCQIDSNYSIPSALDFWFCNVDGTSHGYNYKKGDIIVRFEMYGTKTLPPGTYSIKNVMYSN